MTITISEPTYEQAERRVAEPLQLYRATPLDRILHKGMRYVVTLKIL